MTSFIYWRIFTDKCLTHMLLQIMDIMTNKLHAPDDSKHKSVTLLSK